MKTYINLALKYLPFALFALSFIIFISILKSLNKSAVRPKNEKNNLKNFTKRLAKSKIFKIISRIIDYFTRYTTRKLLNSNGLSIKANTILAIIIEIIYIITVIFLYKYNSRYSIIWYSKVLNLAIALFIPAVFYNLFFSFRKNTVLQQLPDCFSEISSHYKSYLKIDIAVKEALPYMSKETRTIFNRFYEYIKTENTFEEGLDYLLERINSPHIKIFCQILKKTRNFNDDISYQLTQLSRNVRVDLNTQLNAKRKFAGYRILLLLLIITIPLMPEITKYMLADAYKFYYTVEGNILFCVAFIFVITSYFISYIFENSY